MSDTQNPGSGVPGTETSTAGPSATGSVAGVPPAERPSAFLPSAGESRSRARAAKRAAKASEKAAKAQARAEEARREALDAAIAGGLIDPAAAAAAAPAVSRAPLTPSTPSAASTHPAQSSRPAPGRPADAGRGRSSRTPAQLARDSRAGRRAPAGPPRWLVPMLLVAALLLSGFAAWTIVGWHDARDEVARERTLNATPEDAAGAASSIVTDMFTYDWQDIAAKMDSVEPRLTGDAENEFRTSSRPAVESAAKEQKASVFSTVAAAAPVEVVDSDHVRVLVMLNRMVSTAKDPKAQSASSRIEVQMQRVDGQWKLAKLKSI